MPWGSRKNNEPIIKNRTAEQKAVVAAKQKKLNAARQRSEREEADLRKKLNGIKAKAGKKNLTRAEIKFLKDNGEWGAASKGKSYQKNKGVDRW
jgi:hypothetical protein